MAINTPVALPEDISQDELPDDCPGWTRYNPGEAICIMCNFDIDCMTAQTEQELGNRQKATKPKSTQAKSTTKKKQTAAKSKKPATARKKPPQPSNNGTSSHEQPPTEYKVETIDVTQMYAFKGGRSWCGLPRRPCLLRTDDP
jgi:hypothetical protein